MAQNGVGFYSDSEFRLEMMPWRILENSIELGRACILKEYRNSRTLFLLWCGIAQYLKFSNKRYLFGCCSLTSQDEQKGMSLWKWLFINNKIDLSLKLYPRLEYEIKNGMDFLYVKYSDDIPPLLSMYLRYGAKVIGKPAIDRDFKTIDYFLLLDSLQMPQASYDTFMQK